MPEISNIILDDENGDHIFLLATEWYLIFFYYKLMKRVIFISDKNEI